MPVTIVTHLVFRAVCSNLRGKNNLCSAVGFSTFTAGLRQLALGQAGQAVLLNSLCFIASNYHLSAHSLYKALTLGNVWIMTTALWRVHSVEAPQLDSLPTTTFTHGGCRVVGARVLIRKPDKATVGQQTSGACVLPARNTVTDHCHILTGLLPGISFIQCSSAPHHTRFFLHISYLLNIDVTVV